MDSEKALWGCGSLVVVGLLFVVAVMFSGAQVSAGYVGVVSNFGAIDQSQQPITPGFHLVMPFQTHIESVSVQPQNHQFSEVAAASKELQNVYVDGGVNYHVDASSAAKLVTEGGVDAVVNKVFNPAFQDYIKEIVPQYDTEAILANRAQIRDAVKSELAAKAQPYGLYVDDVFITNIHFDKDYTAAIEQKQVAQQNLEQAKIDAQTAVTKAQGQAQANATLEASLNQVLIEWQQLQIQQQEIAKWNGVMPQVVGSANPFVTLTTGTKS